MSAEPDAVVVHHATRPPTTDELDLALAVLDREERDRADRLRSAVARARFIWRRGLRRQVLAHALGVDPAVLAFAALCPVCGSRDHGKPYLPEAPDLHFSAAQSGEHTVVAFGPSPLGVDVQSLSGDLDHVAEVFSRREQAALAGASGLDRATLWTRKEAYLKAQGIGLTVDPAGIEALGRGLEPGRGHRMQGAGRRPMWAASWRGIDAALSIACAARRPVRRLQSAACRADGFVPAAQTMRIGLAKALPKGRGNSI